MAIGHIDHHTFHLPDGTVRSVDLLSRSNLLLVQWNGVVGEGSRHVPNDVAQALEGLGEVLAWGVARAATTGRQKLRLLRMIEPIELSRCALQTYLAGRDVNEVQRHEPAQAPAVLRLNHQMGDNLGDGIDDNATDRSAGLIEAPRLGPNGDLDYACLVRVAGGLQADIKAHRQG